MVILPVLFALRKILMVVEKGFGKTLIQSFANSFSFFFSTRISKAFGILGMP